ncbi:hypothetical protein GOP47_0005206 [Adiantum capillus-veneris]|uniref:Uncharacterized protein n=1 Tax=Adiantum capillus-veneris TaxID=13818 RepID=A0A9D4V5E6_ADICA|nr:hypothetical protein GOP47_0005206 [Adiantum capillus-veneris]
MEVEESRAARQGGEEGDQDKDGRMSVVEKGRWFWAAMATVTSAVAYLVDFGTNIKTMQLYYHYDFECRQAALNDAVCHRLMHNVNNYASAFGVSLAILVGAHLSYSIIFWFTLPARAHPLRLAYFLPLIHLSRLLKVLWRATFSRSCQSVKDLLKTNQEINCLYDILGASLETSPQLILQFHIAMVFGNYSASDEGAVPIPRELVLSMAAAILSGIYNGSMALVSISKGNTFASSLIISIAGGLHTAATMVAHTTIIGSLLTAYHSGFWLPPYAFLSFAIPWIFFELIMRLHDQNTSNKQSWRILRYGKSFALAHMISGDEASLVRRLQVAGRFPLVSDEETTHGADPQWCRGMRNLLSFSPSPCPCLSLFFCMTTHQRRATTTRPRG